MNRQNANLENLRFEPSYFQDEVREGFFVSTMMKRYWAAQIKVLSYIAQICEHHGLKWFMDCGSLIGTIRHEGYIPWDDDLDICMLRDDWKTFFDVAAKELPPEFMVLTLQKEPEYDQIIGRVVNSGSINIGPEHMEEFFGCPYTVGIDIFPLDGLYEDEEKEKNRVFRAKKAVDEYESTSDPSRRRKLILEIEKIYSEVPTKDASRVALMPFWVTRNSHNYPKELFEYAVDMPFEGTLVKVPARYDEVLDIEYRNYMQVIKDWKFHDYPTYGDQEATLRQHLGRNPYRYSVDYNALVNSVKRYSLKMMNASMNMGAASETGLKKVVVFLPCRACWWSSMEPLWKKYSEDDSVEVHVLPIFYFDCDYSGNIGEKHDERALFSDYVKTEDCASFDFGKVHPDETIIQVPFDEYSSAMTVHEFFYSSNLLKFTDNLAYVPCFDMDSPARLDDKASAAITPLIEQPAVVNADKVLVKSEIMKKLYVERMVALCTEDTRGYWENKVEVMENIGASGTGTGRHDDVTACTTDGNKKLLVYHVTISMLLKNREKALDKIKRSLEIFEESGEEVCMILVPQRAILDELPKIDEKLWNEFQRLVDSISAMKNVTYDAEGKYLDLMDKWNGYYGDKGAVAHKCQELGVPVMIENVEI